MNSRDIGQILHGMLFAKISFLGAVVFMVFMAFCDDRFEFYSMMALSAGSVALGISIIRDAERKLEKHGREMDDEAWKNRDGK